MGGSAGIEMSKCDAIKICKGVPPGKACAGKAGTATACSSAGDDCATSCANAEPGTGSSNAKNNAVGSDFSWRCLTTDEIAAGCPSDASSTTTSELAFGVLSSMVVFALM